MSKTIREVTTGAMARTKVPLNLLDFWILSRRSKVSITGNIIIGNVKNNEKQRDAFTIPGKMPAGKLSVIIDSVSGPND